MGFQPCVHPAVFVWRRRSCWSNRNNGPCAASAFAAFLARPLIFFLDTIAILGLVVEFTTEGSRGGGRGGRPGGAPRAAGGGNRNQRTKNQNHNYSMARSKAAGRAKKHPQNSKNAILCSVCGKGDGKYVLSLVLCLVVWGALE